MLLDIIKISDALQTPGFQAVDTTATPGDIQSHLWRDTTSAAHQCASASHGLRCVHGATWMLRKALDAHHSEHVPLPVIELIEARPHLEHLRRRLGVSPRVQALGFELVLVLGWPLANGSAAVPTSFLVDCARTNAAGSHRTCCISYATARNAMLKLRTLSSSTMAGSSSGSKMPPRAADSPHRNGHNCSHLFARGLLE